MSQKPFPKDGILDITPYVGGKSSVAKSGQGDNQRVKMRVVKLSSNETPLGASPKAKAAYAKAVDSLHRYPDGQAVALRAAIGNATGIPAAQIVCGAGSDELIALLINAYVNRGDEVVISEHGFLMYKIYAQIAGAKIVIAKEKNLRSDVDSILKAVSEKTKIVFIANPNNPTGSYINKAEMARLQAGLPPQVILAIDGAYAEYANVPDYCDGRQLVESCSNVVMLRTFSKIYGLSSLRLGWCYAPPEIADVLNRVRGPFNVSTPSMEAGIAAIEDVSYKSASVSFNQRELTKMENNLRELPLIIHPSIANFILVEFKSSSINGAERSAAQTAKAASEFLMEKGLIVREVANYGLSHCLRISIGLEEDNKAVVSALAEFLSI